MCIIYCIFCTVCCSFTLCILFTLYFWGIKQTKMFCLAFLLYLTFCFVFYFQCWDGTQGFVYARKVLYYWTPHPDLQFITSSFPLAHIVLLSFRIWTLFLIIKLSKSEIQVVRLQALVMRTGHVFGCADTGFVKGNTLCCPFICVCC